MALSLSSLASVVSASNRWITSSISLSRPLRISSFSSRSRFSSHASWGSHTRLRTPWGQGKVVGGGEGQPCEDGGLLAQLAQLLDWPG